MKSLLYIVPVTFLLLYLLSRKNKGMLPENLNNGKSETQDKAINIDRNTKSNKAMATANNGIQDSKKGFSIGMFAPKHEEGNLIFSILANK